MTKLLKKMQKKIIQITVKVLFFLIRYIRRNIFSSGFQLSSTFNLDSSQIQAWKKNGRVKPKKNGNIVKPLHHFGNTINDGSHLQVLHYFYFGFAFLLLYFPSFWAFFVMFFNLLNFIFIFFYRVIIYLKYYNNFNIYFFIHIILIYLYIYIIFILYRIIFYFILIIFFVSCIPIITPLPHLLRSCCIS